MTAPDRHPAAGASANGDPTGRALLGLDRPGCAVTPPDGQPGHTNDAEWACSQPGCTLNADGHDLTLLLHHELGISVSDAFEARAVILATLAHDYRINLDALRAIA